MGPGTYVEQAVTKCGTVAPPVRGTKYFARHKMVNVNDKKLILFLQDRRVPLFELQINIYKAKVYLYGAIEKSSCWHSFHPTLLYDILWDTLYEACMPLLGSIGLVTRQKYSFLMRNVPPIDEAKLLLCGTQLPLCEAQLPLCEPHLPLCEALLPLSEVK